MRTKGSCKFEPYYKVEVFNPAALCWSPVQRSYKTEVEAIESAPSGKFRVIEISEDGVQIII